MAAFAFGLITLASQEYNGWHLLRAIGSPAFVYAVAAAQIFGGIAVQFRLVAKSGAVALCAVYLVFALLWVARIFAAPRIFDLWGNFFEQFSLVVGAAFIYASMSPSWKAETVNRIGRILLSLCAASFALRQAMELSATAGLVPKWLPPSPQFWATMTTVAFVLAAVALLTNRVPLLATRLLTAMLVIFGLLVWVPLLIVGPRNFSNWGEIIETFAIAGAAWILADLLDKELQNHPT